MDEINDTLSWMLESTRKTHMFEEPNQPVRVAAGVLREGDSVLLCQRKISRRYGLKWEFPGGKTYAGEQISECLERELMEELNIEPVAYQEMKTVHFDYPDGGKFLITFFEVLRYTGTIENKVFERMEWVPVAKLPNYDMLEGTLPLLDQL